MKAIRSILVGLIIGSFAIESNLAHAQSAADFLSQLQSLESGETSDAVTAPRGATYYSASMINEGGIGLLPFPANVGNWPVWNLPGTTIYLMDDLDATASTQSVGRSRARTADDTSGPPGFGDPGDGGGDVYTNNFVPVPLNTNALFLTISNVSGGLLSGGLGWATNQVYGIESSTNLLSGWQMEQIIFPTDTNLTPFTVSLNQRNPLFLRAFDWTGLTENGNTTPDWWFYYWFGTTDLTDTNLDSAGNSFLADYQAGTDPNIIRFSVQVTNNYSPGMNVPAQLAITYGTPGYYAVSVDDTNYATDATWQTYTTPNLNVNLGSSYGWHEVWIGLKGSAPNATVTWQWKHLNWMPPPMLVITNPAVNTVAQPMIQIYGYSQNPLASIRCDVSNAAGAIYSLPAAVTDRYYDTNSRSFTTNYFECLDVPLTNGVNTIALSATDLAGNITATNFNFTVDYSGKTNPPVMQLAWPQTGTQISGSAFTLRGQIDDPTATVTTQLLTTNRGIITTNVYAAAVERNGKFWLENLPLQNGANAFTLTTRDAAGNTSAANISVGQSPVVLAISHVDGDLWSPVATVFGTISDSSCTVWVNGVESYGTGNGTWGAAGVPVNSGGVANFTVTAYPANGSTNAAVQTDFSQDKPPRLYVKSCNLSSDGSLADRFQGTYVYDDGWYGWKTTPVSGTTIQTYHEDMDWTEGAAGTYSQTQETRSGSSLNGSSVNQAWLASRWGYANNTEIDVSYDENGPITSTTNYLQGVDAYREHCAVHYTSDRSYPEIYGSVLGHNFHIDDQRTADTTLHLQTGGRATAKQLFQLNGTATQVDPANYPGALSPRVPYGIYYNSNVLAQNITIGSYGRLNPSGVVYASIAGETDVDVTPAVAGMDFYHFNCTPKLVQTKADWQKVVQDEIDRDSGVQIENYNAADGFMANRKNLQAVYAFYQKLFVQNTNFLWAGLAKLAGADVCAGLSDAQYSYPVLATFQQTLIQMNIDIMNDLAWQFEAYKYGGTNALGVIDAADATHTSVDMDAWEKIDQGIKTGNVALIREGNESLLQREQQQVLANGYSILNNMTGISTIMSLEAQSPILLPDSDSPVQSWDFQSVVPNGNICVFNDRWAWITDPSAGIWMNWLIDPNQVSDVKIPLMIRAAIYSTFPLQ